MFQRSVRFPLFRFSIHRWRLALSFVLTVFAAISVSAQDGGVDPSFDQPVKLRGTNDNYFVGAIFPQSDGKILVGGSFNSLGGSSRLSLTRLNSDGTADRTFNSPFRLLINGTVSNATQDNLGRVLIRGDFQTLGGIPRPGFARLRNDGSVDTAFLPPSGVEGFTISQQGRIFVWGRLVADASRQRRGLVRLNADGSIDSGFNPSLHPDDSVQKAAIDPSGRIVILGNLLSPDGTFRPKLIRLDQDGTLDSTFTSGVTLKVFPSLNSYDLGFAIDPLGRILIQPDLVQKNRLVRLSPNGAVDSTFNAAVPFGTFLEVFRIGFDQTARPIILRRNNLIPTIQRLNQDGSIDQSFAALLPNIGGGVSAIATDQTGRILIGGRLNTPRLSGSPANGNLLRLNNNGSIDPTFNFEDVQLGFVEAVATDASENVLVGGFFTSVGTRQITGLARINANGDVDGSFRPFSQSSTSGLPEVTAIAVDSNQRILVWGNFSRIGGGNRLNLARLNPDGTLDATFDAGNAPTPRYNDKIAISPDGKIYLGGSFTEFNGNSRPGLARLNANGSVDPTFQPVFGNQSFAIASADKVIVRSPTGLARLNQDGSIDPSFSTQFSPNQVYFLDLAVVENDRVLVGQGSIEVPRNQLFRLNSDGSPDPTFSNPLGPEVTLYRIGVAPNGKVLVNFFENGSKVGRLNPNGTFDATFKVSSLFGYGITQFSVASSGRIIIGGLIAYDEAPRNGIARLITDTCLDSVSPMFIQAPAGGQAGNLNFSVPGPACPRRVESDYPWISVLSNGTGSATVAYTIAPNDGLPRTGYIRVNERLVTVSQESSCSYSISPDQASFSEFGGSGTFTISCSNDCAWKIGTVAEWVVITDPLQGRGNATIHYRVLPNPGSRRSQFIILSDQPPFDPPGSKFLNISQRARKVSTPGSYRPSTGFAYLRDSSDTGFADREFFYGQAGDIPVAGDWTGIGFDFIGVYRNGVFYLKLNLGGGIADLQFPYGQPGDIPIAGDWDGDGIDTIGVIRGNRVLLRNSNSAGPADIDFNYGADTDIFIVGDWNGDGIDTIGAYRQSNGFVYLRNSNTSGFADTEFFYGLAGDRPIAGDWDGDGIDTIGVVRGNRWLLRNSNTSGFADIDFNFGTDTDIPIVGDWNGAP